MLPGSTTSSTSVGAAAPSCSNENVNVFGAVQIACTRPMNPPET